MADKQIMATTWELFFILFYFIFDKNKKKGEIICSHLCPKVNPRDFLSLKNDTLYLFLRIVKLLLFDFKKDYFLNRKGTSIIPGAIYFPTLLISHFIVRNKLG